MSYHRSHYHYEKERHTKRGIFCIFKNKQCIHYETQKKAEHALEFVNEYDNPNYVPQRAYHCDCGFWHLTSKPSRNYVA